MIEWKDITSYSRGDKKQEPTTWEIRHGKLSICVVRGHRQSATEWCFHCPALGFDTHPLEGVSTVLGARVLAVETVKAHLVKLQESLGFIRAAE